MKRSIPAHFIFVWLVPTLLMTGCSAFNLSADKNHQEPAVMLILAGQSNMVGQGKVEQLPENMRTFPEFVHLVDYGRPMRVEDEPQTISGNRFGPEVALAQELAKAWKERETVLVKHAVGGTSLLAWSPDWDSTRAERTGNAGAGPLYSQLVDTIKRVTASQKATPVAVLWMQGERDARFEDVGDAYLENLEHMIAQLREDLDAPTLPFILGRVNPPPGRYPRAEEVRTAQEAAARRDPFFFCIDIDDLSKHPDNVHYDTDGQLELGRRFAKAVLGVM